MYQTSSNYTAELRSAPERVVPEKKPERFRLGIRRSQRCPNRVPARRRTAKGWMWCSTLSVAKRSPHL